MDGVIARELSKKFLDSDISSFQIGDVQCFGELMQYHNALYYEHESPIISDFEYDMLHKKLKLLEEKFHISNVSDQVGSTFQESSFEKVPHSRPMISLDNTYNEEDLREFDLRVQKNLGYDKELQYSLEFKFDGLGIELIYKSGKFYQAITRGNGIEGEDVTQNIATITNIPKTISYLGDLEVRGEVVMPISSFEQLNKNAQETGDKIFANPRNAASGSVRMLDTSVTASRKLKFFAYDLANFSDFTLQEKVTSYFDVIKKLEVFGFEISQYFHICQGIDGVIEKISHFGDIKKQIDFEIDGLVIKVNSVDLWEKIGWTQHHPRYAIAYKFPAEIASTKIIGVQHSVGRTGTVTPVALLQAIQLSGVTVKRATLHNYDEVAKLDVHIGDTIFIKRAGEVIPKIISVVKEARSGDIARITVPEFCPECQTKLVQDIGKVRFFCPNTFGCPAQVRGTVIYAVGKQGFDIDGLGEKQVELFFDVGILHSLADVFRLESQREQILELEGFQEKSVKNLIEAIDKAKKQPISRFLSGLGIPGVGPKMAKILANLFTKESDLIDFPYSIEDFENLYEVGPETARAVYDFFTQKKHLIQELIELMEIYFPATDFFQGKLKGKKVCITGSFQGVSREKIIELIEQNGGEFVSSVSKNTDFLVAGESAGSKLEKAKSLGIFILSLEELYNFLQDS